MFFFLDQISVHFGSAIFKSPGFVPFRTNLIHIGAKSAIPAGVGLSLSSGALYNVQADPRCRQAHCRSPVYDVTWPLAVTQWY